MIITNTFGYMIYPGHTTDLLTLMCVVLGIVFGVLALKMGKPVLIISTSLIGSCMVVWGVGYFAGQFPNAHDLEQYASKDIDGKLVYSIPDAWWGYLAGIVVLFAFGVYIQFKKTARNVKDNRPKGFGKQKDVNEYIERKTARNKTQDSLDMEAPPRRQRQVRRQKEFQEQRQPRQVREVREVRTQPNKKRSIKQQAPPSPQYTNAPSRQYADLGATDEIIEYEERIPQQKRIIYSDRESDLYDFESNRDPCRFCGDYVHLDGSCCTEKTVRLDRH
ncbi:hypothetical protein PHMEG_00030012 [Phytophthora megakarya]|uniref:Transmembrane protein 198 n=1 Tax=Phytophthora megakarya TaxID=4795 RepID=A0A225V2U2_9STRA|nr:hypothetical protein PHMEG_00030012 [Phytophthora megakarya]